MKKWSLRFCTLAMAIALFLATAVTAFAVVEPTEQFYVADYANVLQQDTKDDIVEKNAVLYEQTGAQIVVVTVDFLDGMAIEDYALELFNEWGIGSAEKNNGVLLLLAIGEENYWVLQGKGIEPYLSSATLKGILDESLEPDFAKGDYDAGVQKTFTALLQEVEEIYAGDTSLPYTASRYEPYEPYEEYETRAFRFSIGQMIGLVVVLVLVVYTITRFAGRGGGCCLFPIFIGGRRPRPPRPPFRGGFGPRPPRPPRPPFGGGFGGHGSRSGFGGGAGRGGFGGGSHRGGGGSSRGGGAGRG